MKTFNDMTDHELYTHFHQMETRQLLQDRKGLATIRDMALGFEREGLDGNWREIRESASRALVFANSALGKRRNADIRKAHRSLKASTPQSAK